MSPAPPSGTPVPQELTVFRAPSEARDTLATLEEVALRAPEKVAIEDPFEKVTYGALLERANNLARACVAQNVGTGVVGIRAARTASTVAAMIGVLKAGACFALFDADHPTPYLIAQLRLVKPALLLDASPIAIPRDLAQFLSSIRVVPAAAAASSGGREGAAADSPADARPNPSGAAYILFGSGTGGLPKAVAASRECLANFLAWEERALGITAEDRFSGLSGLQQSGFVRDVFTPLCAGASLHLPTDEVRAEPKALGTWMEERRVSVTHLTGSRAARLAHAGDHGIESLRCVLLSGEPLDGSLLARLRARTPNARYVSLFGVAETSQAVGYYPITTEEDGPIPLGRGISGVDLFVRTDDGGLAAAGVEGEICVRSPYLPTSYLDGAQGGFGVNPFTGDPKDRVYRTGDLGVILLDGNITRRGRADTQVEIRGYRVDLEQLEERIRAVKGVRQCAVTVSDDRWSLVAHVVGSVNGDNLLSTLQKKLPGFMVPSSVVTHAALPMTPKGKVDRNALLAAAASTVAAPATLGLDNPVEEQVASVLCDILGLERIGRLENFFDVGLHSLNAVLISARFNELLAIDVPVRLLFDLPTVATLAERITLMLIQSATSDELGA